MKTAPKNALLAPAPTSDFQVSIAQDAIEFRDDLIIEASFIEVVASEHEAKQAAHLVAQLKGFTKTVEESRVAVKKPFKEAAEAIDAAAKSAVYGAVKQAERIEQLLGQFQREQLRKAQEERLRREQAAKAEQELIAKLAREAEEARQRAEQAKGKAKTQAEAEAEQKEEKALDAALEAQERPAEAPVDTTLKGAQTIPEYDYEVTDIEALYEAQPGLVDLSPRKADIKRFINAPGAKHDIPGLRIFEDVKVRVRAVTGQAAQFLK